MNNSFEKYIAIEDFLLDNDFVAFVKKATPNDIEQLFEEYPDKKEIIEQVVVLIKYVKIDSVKVPEAKVEESLGIALSRIEGIKQKKRKKKALYTIMAIISAACLFVFFFILNPSLESDKEKQQLFSLLESAEMDIEEVQIIAGDNKTNVANNETVIQTDKGDVLVGEREEMNSSAIKTEYVTLVVPKGKRVTLKLSDGSTLWVNSETKVAYPKIFSEKAREISVDGEVFLDVSKKTSPFIVHTKSFDIKVLGTQFNVSAYSADAEKSVVLVNGAVEIHEGSERSKLQPNEGFFSVNGTTDVRNVDVASYICWKDAIMILGGESLDVIMTRLGRYYGLKIHSASRFEEERYVGKINLKEPIETVLHNISLSTNLKYKIIGDVVYVD